jgi:hypothetical protein
MDPEAPEKVKARRVQTFLVLLTMVLVLAPALVLLLSR